jgi:hypothetical protein
VFLTHNSWKLGALVALGAGALVHGCDSSSDGKSSGGGGAAGQAGAGASGSAGAGAIGGASGGGAGTGGGSGAQPGFPSDWELYPGYSDCPIYVPGEKGKLPDPVEWEPCPSPGPANSTCRRMKTPWTETNNNSITAFPNFWSDPSSGKAYLQFGRIYVGDDAENRFRYYLVADADGPILNAFFVGGVLKPGCTLLTQSVQGGKYAFNVGPTAPPGPGQVEGVLAGDIGSLPSVVLSNPVDGGSTGWEVSSAWLVRIDEKIRARRWGSSDELLVQSPAQDPEGMSAFIRGAVGEAIFWEVGGLTYHGVMAWTEADGARSLVRYPGDYTEGAGSFGTDGVDLVWTHGEGKAPSDWNYPTRDIMTAPFSTDPDVVKATARRLRSDPGQIGIEAFAVGCGYAARTFYVDVDAGSGASGDLLIVRLTDGVSWIVDAPPVSTGVIFARALGFTCEEVFALVQFPDDALSFVRMRLDSLGPGITPD